MRPGQNQVENQGKSMVQATQGKTGFAQGKHQFTLVLPWGSSFRCPTGFPLVFALGDSWFVRSGPFPEVGFLEYVRGIPGRRKSESRVSLCVYYTRTDLLE